MKQIDLLAALVEDAESGSDAVVLSNLVDEIEQLIGETANTLIAFGNECNSYRAELDK